MHFCYCIFAHLKISLINIILQLKLSEYEYFQMLNIKSKNCNGFELYSNEFTNKHFIISKFTIGYTEHF